MKEYKIYERITNLFGDRELDYVGSVSARNEQSALKKAGRLFKVDDGGVPARRRNAENFVATDGPWLPAL